MSSWRRFLITLPFLAASFLLVVRAREIARHPVDDFDTNAVIGAMRDGVRPWRTFIDVAHPGLLGLLVRLGRSVAVHLASAETFWVALVCAALAASALTLTFGLRGSRTAPGISLGAVLATVYLASPVIADLASRAEENLLFHALFVATLLTLAHRMEGRETTAVRAKGTGWTLAALGLALAALHLQPFLILAMGTAAYAFRTLVGRTPADERGRRRWSALAVFAGPPLLLYAALFRAARFPVPDYPRTYLSIIHNDSIVHYAQAVLLFAQGYLVTGHMPFRWTATALAPTSRIYWLGAPLLLGLLFLARHLCYLDFVLLTSLGFALLYEPSSSERWDTVLLAFLVRVARLPMLHPARMPLPAPGKATVPG